MKTELKQNNEFLMAYYATQPMLSFETIMSENDEFGDNNPHFVNMAGYSCRTPEQIVIERERWQNLREETKQVIELIVNCPAEVFREITKRNHLTENSIARYLRRQWGERLIVAEVIKEIKQYVREVEDDKIR